MLPLSSLVRRQVGLAQARPNKDVVHEHVITFRLSYERASYRASERGIWIWKVEETLQESVQNPTKEEGAGAGRP